MPKKNETFVDQAKEVSQDALERVAGGFESDSITLFKLECPCAWVSDTVPCLSEVKRCPVCGRYPADGFIKYAYVFGEWIRIDPD